MWNLKVLMELMAKYNLDEKIWLAVRNGKDFHGDEWSFLDKMSDTDANEFCDQFEVYIDFYPMFSETSLESVWNELFYEIVKA